MNAIAPIIRPGIYDIPAQRYHSDPTPTPSLSNSIAKKLIRQSPMHAHYAHPRLGGAGNDNHTSAMDDGTILHALLLGKGGENVEIIYADDFKKKVTQEARDDARAAGKTPVLAHKMAALCVTADAARKQIEDHPAACELFGPGSAEHAILWEEDGIWLRSLVDFIPDNPNLPLLDIKTTGLSAAPEEWEQRLIKEYAVQDAFYSRGFHAVTGRHPPPMQFIVVETDPPYGVSVMAAAPTLRAVAEAEVERAVRMWRHCMKTGRWPGYPPFVASVEAPNWLLNKMEEQESRDQFVKKYDPISLEGHPNPYM